MSEFYSEAEAREIIRRSVLIEEAYRQGRSDERYSLAYAPPVFDEALGEATVTPTAHEVTTDEREALTLIVRDVHNYDGRPGFLSLSGVDAGRIAEAILAAGFRRSEASESSVETWVCGKCGESAYEHSLTTSTCIWEPVETRPEPQGEPSAHALKSALG